MANAVQPQRKNQIDDHDRDHARAIKQVTALEAVIIPVIEPILNPVWVMIFNGERPSSLSLVGGLIVLGAVTWRAITSIRSRQIQF